MAECVYRADAHAGGASPRSAACLACRCSCERVDEPMHSSRCCAQPTKPAHSAHADGRAASRTSTDLAHLTQDLPEQADLLESDDDAPIIRMINALLTQAVNDGASDIHIEPYENRLGRCASASTACCATWCSRKRALHAALVSRLKSWPKLDIAEKRLPQDGRIAPAHRRPRRSTCASRRCPPATASAWCCACSTSRRAGSTSTRSAWTRDALTLIDELIHKPHGILLVTGPTGSGKTTTLYAALERLNDNTRNIMTVEDPIEYDLDGIGQTQVNAKIDLTFARGLRAILRQDPDVIMIGEIRDLETAQIAVQASLTGHLVLATLHTNDRRRRGHAPARHGRRAVPALLEPARRARAAPGARAEPATPSRRSPPANTSGGC